MEEHHLTRFTEDDIIHISRVLGALNSYYEDGNVYFADPERLNEYMDEGHSIPLMYITLSKIYKDGFAEIKYKKVGGVPDANRPEYYISYDGIIFLKSGGYTEKFVDNWDKHRKERELLNNQIDYTKHSKYSNWTIAIATVIIVFITMLNTCTQENKTEGKLLLLEQEDCCHF